MKPESSGKIGIAQRSATPVAKLHFPRLSFNSDELSDCQDKKLKVALLRSRLEQLQEQLSLIASLNKIEQSDWPKRIKNGLQQLRAVRHAMRSKRDNLIEKTKFLDIKTRTFIQLQQANESKLGAFVKRINRSLSAKTQSASFDFSPKSTSSGSIGFPNSPVSLRVVHDFKPSGAVVTGAN